MAYLAPAIPWISAALTAVGTGVAVYGAVQASKSAEEMAEYNAKVAKQQAEHLRRVGDENLRRRREMNQRYLATQRAQYAKAGVLLQGSPLAVLGKSASALELEAMDIAYQTELAAQRSFAEARMAKYEGSQASRAYQYQAGSSLISGLGTTGSVYSDQVYKGGIKDTYGIYR